MLFQFMYYLLRRRRKPFFLPGARHYGHALPGLEVDVEEARRPPVAVLTCRGEVTQATAEKLRAHGARLLEGSFTRLVVDLDEVHLVDSQGIGALVALQKRAARQGGALVLGAVPEQVRRTLRLARLD
jgi:anti-sigma B factor antagonist